MKRGTPCPSKEERASQLLLLLYPHTNAARLRADLMSVSAPLQARLSALMLSLGDNPSYLLYCGSCPCLL